MPNYSSPGHPYGSQSIHVTMNPLYKSKSATYAEAEFKKQSFSPRPTTGLSKISPQENRASNDSSPRSARIQTAPAGYKEMPPVNKTKKLITQNFLQMTPWCREMYRWFTPDPRQGVWHDNVDMDKHRRLALRERLPARKIYHVESGLMPSYSGYVPGQKFRYGRTWGVETVNSNKIGLSKSWESTSFFQNRPLGA